MGQKGVVVEGSERGRRNCVERQEQWSVSWMKDVYGQVQQGKAGNDGPVDRDVLCSKKGHDACKEQKVCLLRD